MSREPQLVALFSTFVAAAPQWPHEYVSQPSVLFISPSLVTNSPSPYRRNHHWRWAAGAVSRVHTDPVSNSSSIDSMKNFLWNCHFTAEAVWRVTVPITDSCGIDCIQDFLRQLPGAQEVLDQSRCLSYDWNNREFIHIPDFFYIFASDVMIFGVIWWFSLVSQSLLCVCLYIRCVCVC